MIGPIKDGLRKDVKPYAIPEDSFESLVNAYQWRGRIVRRQGYKLLGRLANNTPVMGLRTQELFGLGLQALIAFDTTTAYLYNTTSNSFVILPVAVGGMSPTWSGTDYNFFYSINYAAAFWETNNVPGFHGWKVQSFANQSGSGVGATVEVTAAGNTVAVGDFVYFLNLQGAAAANNLIFGEVTNVITPGVDFEVTATSFPPGITAFTNGAVSDGVVLDSTKSIAGQDGIRYYINGTTWVNYNPPVDPDTALCGCLLMFPYRGYLVFLNTYEGNSPTNIQNFGNRARWTQIGTPYYSEPVPTVPNTQTADPLAARDDIFGRGGANDAPTQEVIIGAAFIRDILVVYFERSTWRLRFVNNSQNPFVWERVNVELGSDCTFSCIPFDKGLMTISNRGIVISDGNDTMRFDQKIPDDVFTIRQGNNGFERVFGIRTFRTKLNYWTFPSDSNPAGTYPDSVLVFNYDTQNWSFFDDCFTCFGYFYPDDVGPTWQSLTDPWASYENIGPSTGTAEQGFETIIAGNQQGFVFLLEQTNMTNDPSLFIQSITLSTPTTSTIINSPLNNLPDGTWITITGVTGTTSDDGVSLNNRNFKIANPTLDPNEFNLTEFEPVDGGSASGSSYTYDLDFVPILPGSVQINIGAMQYLDTDFQGNLYLNGASTPTGTISYTTGVIAITFAAPIAPTQVYIRVVSNDPEQQLVEVDTIGAYTGGGLIAKISNIEITSKIFNFFNNGKRARLSKIDFYTSATSNGQITTNIFADSSDIVINTPLIDNPQSNILTTTPNPYQIGEGSEAINRLFCDCISQTLQVQLILSDRQMAVTAINNQNVELNSMIFYLRQGGRLV